jgi:hypothetical protein
MTAVHDTTPGGLLRDSAPLTAVADEAPARRQPGIRVACHLEDDTLEVTITNRERIHYEKTAAKHKFPPAREAQNLAMTFVCWSAAKRAGLTALTWEQWEDALLDYDTLDEEPADPTR